MVMKMSNNDDDDNAADDDGVNNNDNENGDYKDGNRIDNDGNDGSSNNKLFFVLFSILSSIFLNWCYLAFWKMISFFFFFISPFFHFLKE